MDLSRVVPLFSFGNHHHPNWLHDVATVAKKEPWGRDLKVLELYLRANFEIAKSQHKVYENKEDNFAFWRAGNLVNLTSDPIWLTYNKNSHDFPYWHFEKVTTGEPPAGCSDDYSIRYEPPEFQRNWLIHFNQRNIGHIMGDIANQKRLKDVFHAVLNGKYNEHLIFRAIYGEIELQRKEEAVISQWYRTDYQFLMPLFLTQQDRVELTAVLQPEPAMKKYVIRTLLLPHYAYAYARAIVKSKAVFIDWMKLPEHEIENAVIEESSVASDD